VPLFDRDFGISRALVTSVETEWNTLQLAYLTRWPWCTRYLVFH